ncbi:MAG: SprB repeat-containing protein, partial [Bacteroidia bacterium]|nr:SprB repeat-containing protein [Bacteroidia bacterium]
MYFVTITDTNLCTYTDTAEVLPAPVITIDKNIYNITCYGYNNGAIAIIPSGGVSPYFFNWSTGEVTDSIMGLSAGIYYVTVTDEAYCSVTDSIILSQPSQLSTNYTATDITCAGLTDGTISVTASGGTPPYIYTISYGDFWDSLGVFTELSSMPYQLITQDFNYCEHTDTIFINSPSPLSIISQNSTYISCHGANDGTINVVASGGTGTIQYSIDSLNWQTSGDFTNLGADFFTVHIKDANNCTTTAGQFLIYEPTMLNLDTSVVNSNCVMGDGSANVIVSGGTMPYQYLWSTGETYDTIIGLYAGTYTVTVTDYNLCSASISAIVNDISAGTISFINVIDNPCRGNCSGQAEVQMTGGISPFTYMWSTGETINIIDSLCAGTYQVTVTGADECVSLSSINITEPNELIISVIGTDITCYGAADGTVTANVSGGTFPYFYLWNMGCTDVTCNV